MAMKTKPLSGSRRLRTASRVSCIVAALLGAGCNGGGFGGDRIHEMEMRREGNVATFVIPEHDWFAPFSKPTINEFVVASEEDDVVWRLRAEAETGVSARGLAVTFGAPPAGFTQIVPEETSRPKPLVPGRNYYVAAGGETNVYRVIFALPVLMSPAQPGPTSAPAEEDPAFPRKDMWDKMRQAKPPGDAPPGDAPAMQGEPDAPPVMKPDAPEAPVRAAPEPAPAEEPEAPPQRPSIFGE